MMLEPGTRSTMKNSCSTDTHRHIALQDLVLPTDVSMKTPEPGLAGTMVLLLSISTLPGLQDERRYSLKHFNAFPDFAAQRPCAVLEPPCRKPYPPRPTTHVWDFDLRRHIRQPRTDVCRITNKFHCEQSSATSAAPARAA